MSIFKAIKFLSMTLFGTIVTLSFVPIILPIFLIFSLLSFFVSLLIKIKYRNKAKKATGTDVLSGKETDESPPIINVALRFSGKLNIDKFRARILDVVSNSIDSLGNKRYERLMQIYCKDFGYNIWKDAKDFNIDQHIIVIKLEDLVRQSVERELEKLDESVDPQLIEKFMKLIENSQEEVDWKVLMKCLLNEFGASKMDNSIPQWQMLVLKENDERYTALFRFHHAIADGIYVSRMLCEDFLDSSTELFHSYIPPSRLRKWLLKLWSFCLLPFGLWKIVKNNDKNVLHGPKLTGKKKYYLSNPISMDLLKRLRKQSDTSIHGILFSCLATSLSLHFKRRGTMVEDVTTLIPLPLQNLQKPIQLRNKFAVVSLKLPTLFHDIYSCHKSKMYNFNPAINSKGSLCRLKAVKTVLEEAKTDPTFLSVNSLITACCSFLPAHLAESLLSTKGCSMNFSNLPGPQDEIYFWNDRIEEVMFWIPDRIPLGAGMSMLSYNGQLRAGLALDEALLENDCEGEWFIQDFENEIKNLTEQLENRRNLQEEEKCEDAHLLKSVP